MKRIQNNTPINYYAGNFVYNGSKQLDFIITDEGMVKKTGNQFTYEYYLKDHLGNIRTMFRPGTGGSIITEQVNAYYPFGMLFTKNNTDKNKYLYNGKELQDDILNGTGVEWYDYGARFYDPQIGRFTGPDPLGELTPGINPYHYCYNNPVVLTDPTGMLPGYEPNYIAATFVDPSGKIIKVTDDDDPNIYLVHDPDNWDGENKDGLLIIGQTPEDNTLKDHVGQNINSEEVVNFIFNEADRLGKQEDTWMAWIGLAHLNEFAQLMRSKEEQLKLLAEKKNLEKKRAMILLQMLKNNELMLSDIQRR